MRQETIVVPLVWRPLVGLIIGVLGLIVLAIASVFMIFAGIIMVLMPLLFVFTGRIKVKHK